MQNSRGYQPKKSFGQNFLKDPYHLKVIATEVCGLKARPESVVFEIGAGLGALTRALLDQTAPVYAIERDRDLVPILNQTFAEDLKSERLKLFEANATTFDFVSALPKDHTGPFVLCGNLPYHLTSSLMFQAADLYQHISGAVYLIQSEVAERIAAGPGSKVCGLLSILMQARFDVSVVHSIGPEAFWPAPQVDSSLIKLVPRKEPYALDWPYFQKIVKMAFAQRRKTLKNALSQLEDAEAKMKQAGINPLLRAENLSVQDFVNLSLVVKN